MWRHPRYEELTGRPSNDAKPKPPQPRGELLASFKRNVIGGPDQELRVYLDTYEGHEYISIRLWQRGEGGAWWPLKEKGVSVRLSEAHGVAEALLKATELARPPDDARGQSRHESTPSKPTKARCVRKPASAADVSKVTTDEAWQPDPSMIGAEWL